MLDDADVTGADDIVNDLAELRCFVRFGDDAAETEILITAHRCISSIAAGNDCVHRGIDLDQFFQSLFTAHPAGESKIENHGVESFARFEFLPVNIHALERGGGLCDLITQPAECVFHQRTN